MLRTATLLFLTASLPAQVHTESTHARVRIVDGVADTEVAMTFRNDGTRQAEKIVLLPLPEGAVADQLELRIGGEMQKGDVLERGRARGIYEGIVRRRLDPALLEYVGRDTLRLRVFPIPPRGKQDVKIRFRMILPEAGGLYSYEFPTRAVSGGSFSLDMHLESKKPIKNVYSPLAAVDITRKDDHTARASFESRGRPQRDPVLFYSLSEADFGINLLTYRRKGKDGYFLMMLAPKRKWAEEEAIPKVVSFVIDTSGSMQGEKIKQARRALEFFLESLKPHDRFNIVAFSTEATPFAKQPVQASRDEIAKAKDFVGGLEARGGTNLEEAMRTALRSMNKKRDLPIAVVLTDGLASVGERNTGKILLSCKKNNRSKARIFAFGVGHDVNTQLLDTMSSRSGGTREYVKPGENLEVKTSALFTKIAHPVMTEIELDYGNARVSRLAPSKLPDLFRGSRLIVTGRYKGSGPTAVRLRGRLQKRSLEFVHDASFAAHSEKHDFVATIWAQRRCGHLLDEIRLNGANKELIAEVRRIGTEHGIVTPYTSGLVVEGRGRRRIVYRGPGDSTPRPGAGGGRSRPSPGGPTTPGARGPGGPTTPGPRGPAGPQSGGAITTGSDDFVIGRGPRSGAAAVAHSTKTARLLYLKTLDDKNRLPLRRIGKRAFRRVGGVWIDGAFTKAMQKHVRDVQAFSADYFALLRKHPTLAKVFALGNRIVVVIDGAAVSITPPKRGK